MGGGLLMDLTDMTVIISDLINCEPVISIYCMTIELEIYMPRVMVNLWVQTYQQEYSCYNPISDQFVHIRDKNGKLLAHENFYESSGGDVWLWGKGTGTIRLHKKEDGNFDQQSYLQAEDACNFLLEDSSGKIWIGGKNGLKSISEQGEVKEFYTYEYYFTHAIEVEE